MSAYLSDLVVRISGQSAQNYGILYLLLFSEEVEESRQMLDECSFDFEVLICVKGEVFLS